jgi:hypothetical protein
VNRARHTGHQIEVFVALRIKDVDAFAPGYDGNALFDFTSGGQVHD